MYINYNNKLLGVTCFVKNACNHVFFQKLLQLSFGATMKRHVERPCGFLAFSLSVRITKADYVVPSAKKNAGSNKISHYWIQWKSRKSLIVNNSADDWHNSFTL